MVPELTRLCKIEFPWTRDRIYLNNASIGPIPVRTQRAIDGVEAKRGDPAQFTDTELPVILAHAREAAARLLHASTTEIALAPNTSYGLNMAAQILPLRAGDVVLVPDGEFPANVYPWMLQARRGVQTELVPRTAQGWPDEGRLLERVADPRVRAVAVSFVQFATGYRIDLDRLGAACRAHGTFLVVDAIQGLGQCPLDVSLTPVDILSCGAQKWLLGPWGSGFLYVRHELVTELEPAFAGWMAFRGTDDFTRLTDYDPTFHEDARRFELITLPFQDMAGMTASLGLFEEVGIATVAEHLRALRIPLLEAAARGRFAVVSPTDPPHDCGIWCIQTADLRGTYRRLRAAGVVASLREGSIRLSPHFYTTLDDIARVIEVLDQ
ncbi:MAG: aminotransferase class V-fold PLP-dependent enzyme [Gemmatimonadota bacterium]|nr:aminotransferase class V-fold PLP-dependent enzyme [Gemmatimonadota bacterium]